MAHHVHRIARLGGWVLISEGWYYRPFLSAVEDTEQFDVLLGETVDDDEGGAGHRASSRVPLRRPSLPEFGKSFRRSTWASISSHMARAAPGLSLAMTRAMCSRSSA